MRAVIEWAFSTIRPAGSASRRGSRRSGSCAMPSKGQPGSSACSAAAPDAVPVLRAQALRALGGSTDITGNVDLSPAWYRESLALFTEAGEELEAAHMRFRIAANMVMRGEREAAWPLLEACLAEARELGHPIGECQALGFLVNKARADGEVEKGIALALQSARLASSLGWGWWEAGQYTNAAELERELGRLDEAEQHAARALELSLELGDRRLMVFVGSELAVIAALRGDAARAGLLWGAVEGEASVDPVGQWREPDPGSSPCCSASTVGSSVPPGRRVACSRLPRPLARASSLTPSR